MIRCPKCNSRAVGKIRQNQYYCWDCNVEFAPTSNGFRTYRLELDGTATLEFCESTASLQSVSELEQKEPCVPRKA